MTEDEQTMLLIKGTIADLPPADQATVAECAEKLRGILRAYGPHGNVALALVGAELQLGIAA